MILEQEPLLGFIEIFCLVTLSLVIMSGLVRRHINKIRKELNLHAKALNEINRKINLLGKMQESNFGLEASGDFDKNDTVAANTEASGTEVKLYIGNIDYSVTEKDLKGLFAKFGQIETVNIPIHKYNGKNRGFGFVTFSEDTSAANAISLNGSDFKGRALQINYAKSRG